MPGSGRCDAARGNNMETPHLVETFHAYSVFYFHRTKSFHVNGGPARTAGPLPRRAVLKGTTPPLC